MSRIKRLTRKEVAEDVKGLFDRIAKPGSGQPHLFTATDGSVRAGVLARSPN